MIRVLLQATAVFAALGTGWAVGHAQSPDPAFELVVDTPPGSSTITCVRGCSLMWVERGMNPNDRPQPSFARGGWIIP